MERFMDESFTTKINNIHLEDTSCSQVLQACVQKVRKKVAHALCLLWSSASLQKCHHKERSIAAFWKPKLCCLTTVCVVFRAFGAPHVTWGRPVFPLICLLPQKESILWNTLFRYFILICDRSSQGYWSLTQAVIKTQFGGMGEVFCGFQQPRRFSSPFFFFKQYLPITENGGRCNLQQYLLWKQISTPVWQDRFQS